MNCRISGKKLFLVNDFGPQPLGNGFLKKEDFAEEFFFNMKTGFCKESKMFQLIEQPNPKKMFHENYAFFSSTSKNMKEHFKDWSNQIIQKIDKKKNPFIVELGCNDGIFLENILDNKIRHLGIEPSMNVAKVAKDKNINVITKFFDSNLAKEIINENGKADYFISANVMCHIPEILDVAKGIELLLNENGLLIFEDPYLGDVINQTTYDQIYDEHVYLFSAHSVNNLFKKVNMELIKLEPQTTHGGSMRYTLGKMGKYQKDSSVEHFLNLEIKNGVENYDRMLDFNNDVLNRKNELNKLLNEIQKQNIKICGYAATSKSTTILNYCRINSETIDCIFDTTDIKIGKFSPGMHIPVEDMKNFKNSNYKFSILFAWNHQREIREKELDYIKKGGKWITFSPKIKILG